MNKEELLKAIMKLPKGKPNIPIKYQTEWCQEDEVIRDLKKY